MIRKVREWLQNKVFYTAWLFLHITYQLQLEIREYLRFSISHIKSRLFSCFPRQSQENQLPNFLETVSKLSKVPKHLAISVIPRSQESVLSTLLRETWLSRLTQTSRNKKRDEVLFEDNETDLQTLARVIAWASAANIPVISLYDYNGVLKTRYRELGSYIQDEIVQNFWAVKRISSSREPPIVKFHNVQKTNGYTNGLNGTKSREILHIFAFSRSDGKPAVVKAVQDLYNERFSARDDEDGDSPVPDFKQNLDEKEPYDRVDEKLLDSYLNRYNCWSSSIGNSKTEPDLLFILGNVKSTLGFLPWHVRLTEIHWLPELSNVGLTDVHQSLIKYSKCQQRIGT